MRNPKNIVYPYHDEWINLNIREQISIQFQQLSGQWKHRQRVMSSRDKEINSIFKTYKEMLNL